MNGTRQSHRSCHSNHQGSPHQGRPAHLARQGCGRRWAGSRCHELRGGESRPGWGSAAAGPTPCRCSSATGQGGGAGAHTRVGHFGPMAGTGWAAGMCGQQATQMNHRETKQHAGGPAHSHLTSSGAAGEGTTAPESCSPLPATRPRGVCAGLSALVASAGCAGGEPCRQSGGGTCSRSGRNSWVAWDRLLAERAAGSSAGGT